MTTDNRLRIDISTQASQLPQPWQSTFSALIVEQALKNVSAYIQTRLAAHAVIYPNHPFRALEALAPQDVRVVILGQDPYHGPGQAQGLAFSVPNDCLRPPSLRNIFKELASEYPNCLVPTKNDLSQWSKQGVLLLNTILTVEDGRAASHVKQGWETITDAIINQVAQNEQPKVFMLWGGHAQSKIALLPPFHPHLILTANHPSPLSAARPPQPFLGCGHFRVANDWLVKQGIQPIDWLEI